MSTARRRVMLAAGACGAVLVAALASSVLLADDETAAAATAPSASETATVERRDLVVRETLDGELGFDDTRNLTGQRAGTVTRLAGEGAGVRRGQALYAIDGAATYLLYGRVPSWRTLRRGVDGADVAQLQRNLVALGYDPDGEIDVDGEFGWATEAAVERWEDARGVATDGVVELGDVAFLPGARRVGRQLAEVGAVVQPGAELLETSSRRRVVTVELPTDQQGLVRRGDRVQVELSDGTRVAGRITHVGRVVEQDAGAEGAEEGEPYVTVRVSVPASLRAFDRAPVDVHVARETKSDALAVPIEALLALAGGGYAVEVVVQGTSRLVRVELGTFADGYVEVSGDGLAVGSKVVVAR